MSRGSRRVEPVTATAEGELAALLQRGAESSGLGAVPDFHAVLARHPQVLRRVLDAGLGRMSDGGLSVRQRELLVLRTARLCEGRYEWAHHRRRASERGLSARDVELAWEGPGAAALRSTGPSTIQDRTLLGAADSLHERSTLSDVEWTDLEAAVGTAGAIEAITVVGWFHLICFLGNSVGLEVEPGVDATFGPHPPTT